MPASRGSSQPRANVRRGRAPEGSKCAQEPAARGPQQSLPGMRWLDGITDSMDVSLGELRAFPSPGDLPDPGIEPWSPALQAHSLCQLAWDLFLGSAAHLCRGLAGHCIKPRFPLTCACDLRELLRVPLRSQGYCAVWRGLSRLLWIPELPVVPREKPHTDAAA